MTRRRFQRIARALYMPTLAGVGAMGDREIARLYTSMVAPTPQLAADTFRAWEALPPREREEASDRMRYQVARFVPRGKKPKP